MRSQARRCRSPAWYRALFGVPRLLSFPARGYGCGAGWWRWLRTVRGPGWRWPVGGDRGEPRGMFVGVRVHDFEYLVPVEAPGMKEYLRLVRRRRGLFKAVCSCSVRTSPQRIARSRKMPMVESAPMTSCRSRRGTACTAANSRLTACGSELGKVWLAGLPRNSEQVPQPPAGDRRIRHPGPRGTGTADCRP